MRSSRSIVLVASLLSLGTAHASAILSPVSATATTTNRLTVDGDGVSVFDIRYAINQGGLSTAFESGVTDFDTYLGSSPMHDYLPAYQEWFGANKGFGGGTTIVYPRDTLVFDLGTVYELDRFALWQEENGGVRSATISISTDNIDFTEVLSITVPGNPYDPDQSYQPETYNYGADVFSFTDVVSAQYLQFDLVCPSGNSVYAGCSLGEIAFSVPSSSAPEPGSFAILGLGALVLGAVRRGRRGKADRWGAPTRAGHGDRACPGTEAVLASLKL